MNKRTIITILLAILLIGWMTLIFSFSCEDGIKSGNTSTNVLTGISEIVAPSKSPKETEKIIENNQKIIRKIAHIAMYMVLGALASALATSALDTSVKNRFLISFSFSVFYAATDELHQYFVTGRSGMAEDICLDSASILISVIAVLAAVELYRKRKVKKSCNC